jgi:hypothetical protein
MTGVLLLSVAMAVAAQSPAPAAPAPAEVPEVALTAADAATVLGDWTIDASGAQGSATMLLRLKVVDAQVLAEISSDAMGKSTIDRLTKWGESIVLRYSFDYNGSPVSTVVTLTPDGEKLQASFDFADGAYVMPGTATRKDP